MIETTRLLQLRKENKLTQAAVANSLGVERTTYVRYEHGEIQPPIDMLSAIADFFNVTADYLLGKSNDPAPPSQAPRMPTIEETILNDAELSEEGKHILLSNYKLLKRLDSLKAKNEQRNSSSSNSDSPSP